MRSTTFSPAFLLAALLVLVLLSIGVAAVKPQLKPYIISFPAQAPDSVLSSAKEKVLDVGGRITHEYNIIKGFACEMPESVIEGIKAMSAEFPALIEGDGMVTTNGDD